MSVEASRRANMEQNVNQSRIFYITFTAKSTINVEYKSTKDKQNAKQFKRVKQKKNKGSSLKVGRKRGGN